MRGDCRKENDEKLSILNQNWRDRLTLLWLKNANSGIHDWTNFKKAPFGSLMGGFKTMVLTDSQKKKFPPTLDYQINIGLRLLIFQLFSHGYAFIK